MTARKFPSVPSLVPGSRDDAEGDALPPASPSAPTFSLFVIQNDGQIEAHAIHGTFVYTIMGWYFTPIQFPAERIRVTDHDLLGRLALEVAKSDVLVELSKRWSR